VSTADANRAIQVATPAYGWLARNAHRFGFRPYFYEPWHWEYDPRLAAK
jgi:D-alanyl-D-alanine carboxypeptidase